MCFPAIIIRNQEHFQKNKQSVIAQLRYLEGQFNINKYRVVHGEASFATKQVETMSVACILSLEIFLQLAANFYVTYSDVDRASGSAISSKDIMPYFKAYPSYVPKLIKMVKALTKLWSRDNGIENATQLKQQCLLLFSLIIVRYQQLSYLALADEQEPVLGGALRAFAITLGLTISGEPTAHNVFIGLYEHCKNNLKSQIGTAQTERELLLCGIKSGEHFVVADSLKGNLRAILTQEIHIVL